MSPSTPSASELSENRSTSATTHDQLPDVWWTVPNALCLIRLLGSPVLILLAAWGRPVSFLLLYLFLAATDWLDGKLAILLNQRSKIGPRLDTVSDVTMYASLIIGAVWLKGDFFASEAGWVVAGIATYVMTVGIALAKFRSLPSYHTRAAKIAWFLVLVAIVALFLDWSAWPFRIAAAMVVIANLETSLMSLLLRRRQSDVSTLFHALARERARGTTA